MKYVINGEKLSLKKAVNKLMELPVENFNNFLKKENIFIRKCDIIEILKNKSSKLEKVIKKDGMKKYMSDEYFRRLDYFADFSLYQLMFYVDNYDIHFVFDKFQREIYKFILVSYPNIQIDTIGVKEEEHLTSFLNKIKENLVDLKGYIDGVLVEKTNLSLTKGTTLSEVRKVADFCLIELQRRIKKTDLQELIIFGATRRKIFFNEEELDIIEKGANIKLETLATEYHIPAKIELTKDGIYEYLLMKHDMQIVEKADYITAYTNKFKKIKLKNNFDGSFKTRKESKENHIKNLELQKNHAINGNLIFDSVYGEDNNEKIDKTEKLIDLARSNKTYAVFRVDTSKKVDDENIYTKVVRNSVLNKEDLDNLINESK